MNNDKATKTIFTRWVAGKLVQRGFSILFTRPNPHYPMYDCWVFEDTPELERSLAKIIKEGRHAKSKLSKSESDT
jgi:hypothetical protein